MHAYDEPTVAATIELRGGKVRFDDEQPDKPVTGVRLPYTLRADAELRDLKVFKRLQVLDLRYT